MLHISSELPKNSPQIKQNEKFFTRVLSKESSVANPSLRVYYGGVSGSVPFMWESQPGTPKHSLSAISLPPLTPPPSYYSSLYNKTPSRKYSRSKFLNTLFLKINIKKTNINTSSPSSLSSSSWSSLSWSSSSASNIFLRRRFSSANSSFDERGAYVENEKDSIGSSPTSVMCFGGGRKGYSIFVMKKTLLAMVGRGSG